MRIGVDLDNTIINYEPAFLAEAKRRALVSDSFSGSKVELRDRLHETSWQALQGYVYGEGIETAELFLGVKDFLSRCQKENHAVFIVSHKTRYGHFDEKKTDLREAALQFLLKRGMFDGCIEKENVYFQPTREEKIAVIDKLNLDYFIDDLPDVLLAPSFPAQTKKIHFSQKVWIKPTENVLTCCSWEDVACRVVG